MGRLIDEDGFVERITKLQEEIAENSECYHDDAEIVEVLDYVLVLMGEQPAIEAVEVVYGRWILKDDHGSGVCSNCHRQDKIDPLAGFCRYCGADMRGDQNE